MINSTGLLPTKIVRSLLATTSLTAISAVGAHASTIIESTDFGNSFNTATALPVGTNQVFGSMSSSERGGGDVIDWFEFRSLFGGGSFSLSAIGAESAYRINLFDSTDTVIPYSSVSNSSFGSPTLEGAGTVITGIIPTDGNLYAKVFEFGGGRGNEYEVDLTTAQATAPEPGTSTTLGLGIAAATGLAWRKRRTAVRSV